MKFQQLKHAVRGGDDRLVELLDRDIERSMGDLLEARPASPRELYQQLRFVGELILQNAGDSHSVRRNTNALLRLLDRSFQRPGSELKRRISPPLKRNIDAFCDEGAHLYQSMLDTLSAQVVLVGRDGRVIFANRAFADAHYQRPLECIGRHFNEFEFGNGLPLDFEGRITECFDREPERPENRTADSGAYLGFEPVELRPLFVGRGPAVGVVITFRQGAIEAFDSRHSAVA